MTVAALKGRRTNDFRGDDIGNHNTTRVTEAHILVMYLVGRDRPRLQPDASVRGPVDRFTQREIGVAMHRDIDRITVFFLRTCDDICLITQYPRGRIVRHLHRQAVFLRVIGRQGGQRPTHRP